MHAAIDKYIPYSSHVSGGVLKMVGGDYMVVWKLSGLPFIGQGQSALDHRHNVFNRLLQSLRAPDNENVAFYSHEIRRPTIVSLKSEYPEGFSKQLNARYRAVGTISLYAGVIVRMS